MPVANNIETMLKPVSEKYLIKMPFLEDCTSEILLLKNVFFEGFFSA